MEFWGTEVAPGKPQDNSPGEDTYCHVSQAALGPSKDGKSERVVIRVETGGKNVVLGTLVAGKVDQMSLDLIFDREFKLSHTGTSASVFFCGYMTEKGGEEEYASEEESEDFADDEDDEVPTAVPIKENGVVAGKDTPKVTKKVKEPEQVTEVKAKKVGKPGTGILDLEASEGSSDEDEEDEDEEMDEDFDSEADSDELDDEDSDEDDEEDDEIEEKPSEKVVEVGKKRAQISLSQKSPAGGKKARVDTPAKPGLITTPGKKAGSKAGAGGKITEAKESVAKTPAKDKEASPKTPKSVGDSAKKLGAHTCPDCDRSFATESAVSQHAKAKHKK